VVTPEVHGRRTEIIMPTIKGMESDSITFTGFFVRRADD
jgi:phosphoribosylamine-glycine ligase